MSMLELIKNLCEIKGISIHKLETDLGFSNGSITKSNALAFERVVAIAKYFGVPLDYFDVKDESEEDKKEETQSDAVRLYSQYLKAPSEIRSAIETMLRTQVHDS